MAKEKAPVRSGIETAVGFLLMLAWAILAGSGAMIALSDTSHSRVLGWAVLGVAGAIAVATMDQWVRALPIVLAMALLSGSVSVWNGYLGIDVSRRIPRMSGTVILIILAVCDGLAVRLSNRRLTAVDKVAVFAFLVSFGFAMTSFPSIVGFLLMLACLSITWGYERICKSHST